MAQVEIVREHEGPGGWTFNAQALDDHGELHRFDVHLAYPDYNLWSADGADAPAAVAAAALRFVLSRVPPDEVRRRFDAAMARRMFADADEQIPRWI